MGWGGGTSASGRSLAKPRLARAMVQETKGGGGGGFQLDQRKTFSCRETLDYLGS